MVNTRAFLAEAISTYCLVFFGPLSVILAIASFGEGLTTMSVLFIISEIFENTLSKEITRSLYLQVSLKILVSKDFNVQQCLLAVLTFL